MASPTPTAAPMAKPTAARRNEYHAADSTTRQIGRSDVRLSSSNSRAPMSHTCGMAVSLDRGRMFQPRTEPPSSGPISL